MSSLYRYFSKALLLASVSSAVLADVTPYTLQGCYKELSGSRLLAEKSYTSSTSMTLESCASFCSGYKYFGVEYKSECYCADAIPGPITTYPAAQCNLACSGNASQKCGAAGKLSVYKDTSAPANTIAGQCSVSTSNKDVNLVGSSYWDSSSVVLTNPANNLVGAVWSNKLVKVTEDFKVTFKFKLTHNPSDTTPGCRTPANPTATADGVVFVVSPNKNTAIGSGARNIAYDFKNNFAVEFDSYQNSEFADPAPFHIGVQSCGINKNSGSHSGPCKIANPVNVANQCFDNVEHTAVVEYKAATKTVTVTYDSVLYQTVTYDFASNLDLITGDRAYIGFTSSTGGQFSRQEISQIDYTCQVPAPTVCTVDASSASAPNQVNIVGDATQDVSVPSFVLTTPEGNKAGAVWIKNAITVTQAFKIDFTFNLTHQPNTYTGCQSYYPGGQTADGIAFVISGDTNSRVGGIAQNIGYGGLVNNIAIEFDSWKNDGLFDPDFPHVGVQSCGVAENSVSHGVGGCAVVSPAHFPNDCFDNLVHTATVNYDGTGQFTVKMDGVQVQSFTFNLATNLALIGGTKAYIGITGSTGGQYSRQEVNFVSYPCA